MENKVIITAALAGSATFKNNNPATPYTPKEYAEEAVKAFKAGASMVHIHGRDETMGGYHTSEVDKVKAVYDAIKQKCPRPHYPGHILGGLPLPGRAVPRVGLRQPDK